MTPERYQEVGRLYRAALELEPARWAAFLAEACGGDEAMRQEVASLLNYEARSGRLIDQPALEAVARAMAEDQISDESVSEALLLAGQSIDHFRIISLLGKGGMGEVWLAEDTHLSRKVAIKLLPTKFTTDAGRVRRFASEARTASALNHPNIITIHEIRETGEPHYIVTEHIEGETLRQRMTQASHGRIESSDAIGIALQIAAALAAAHEAGIVHRDMKPENVMLRRDGIVKVLDFGLAKLTERAPPVVDSQDSTLARTGSTEAGVVMGTPRYMSPEQARGEKLDARTDIFSLGVMLYEMISGRAPFAGETTNEVIAALLRDEPPILESAGALGRVVRQALCKDRAERYQSVRDLEQDLKTLQRELALEGTLTVKPDSDARAVQADQLFSAPRSGSGAAQLSQPAGAGALNARRRAVLIALAAIMASIAALAVWFSIYRPARSTNPALTNKNTILLADFENKTGDAIFDGTLKQGLAIELQQTPFLNLFPEARVRQTLREMSRPPDARVTAEIAREICERHNLTALITGSIAPLGSHYAITLEAIDGHSGESLARQQVEADSREQVLRALSQAATQLREHLGESLTSIQRFNGPLAQATTAKLEAFKAWSVGVEHSFGGRVMEAIPAYKRAIELDPDFVAAYSVLASIHWATGQPDLAAEYAQKGYLLKDRVGEAEKLQVTNLYYAFVTGDLNKRIEVLTLLRQLYPGQAGGPDLVVTRDLLGQYEQAVAEGRESIRDNPYFSPTYVFLIRALVRLNRFTEAREILARASQQKLDNPFFHASLFEMAFISGDAAEMLRQLDWMKGKPNEYAAFSWQAAAAASGGQWRKAQELSRRAIDLAMSGNTKEIAARYATEQALRGATFGECGQARADASQGLKITHGRATLPPAALALTLCGEVHQARALVDELTKRYPEDTMINSIWLPVIRAAGELQRDTSGNGATRALEDLHTTSQYEAGAEFWPQYLRGQAYLRLKHVGEAEAEFQKILDHSGYAPLSTLYPLARLGFAHASASRKDYEDFFVVWKEADAELPILRAAHRAYELTANQ